MNLTKLSVNMNDATRDAVKWLALEENTNYTEIVRSPQVDSMVAYDTRQVLRGNVYPHAAARGCGDIESPIFDAMSAHYLTWFFRSVD